MLQPARVGIPSPQTYRPRRPEKTDLFQAVVQNIDLFYEVYDERFLAQHGPLRRRATQAFEAFLRCGRLQGGFARVKCESCGDEYHVAFSCQRRGICSSCQQKRAELLCRFVEEQVIEPVDHRQHVFVVPKTLRGIFHGDREMLNKLCRTGAQATHGFYRAGLGREDVSCGMVLVPQLFGDALNPHVHLHSLVTDGAFDAQGNFHRLLYDAGKDTETLTQLFAVRVLDMLVSEGRLSQARRDDILSWEHTGFSVDASVRVHKGEREGLRRLVRYMARPPVSVERVVYDERSGRVLVKSCKKMNGQRPVKAGYDALTFLALMALQVPPAGTHMVRYYGYYSTRSRAKRREQVDSQDPSDVKAAPKEVPSPEAKARKARWAELLRLVFEVDPLTCEKCGGQMKIISFITPNQPAVLEKILDHLGEPSVPLARGPPKWYQLQLAQEHVDANPHVYGIDEGHGEYGEYDPDVAWSQGDQGDWN